MTDASKGIVYVLTNPAMPDLVKIGKTRQKDINDRLTQLYSTGVPVPFECAFAGVVEDEHKVERAFHKAFGPYRLNPKREFFKIDADQAIALLEILVDEEVTNQVSEQAAQVDPDSKKASDKLRRPNFNFTEMDIPTGAELVFARGGEHKCYVVDDPTCRVRRRDSVHDGSDGSPARRAPRRSSATALGLQRPEIVRDLRGDVLMTSTPPTKSDSAATQTTLAQGEILTALLICTKVANGASRRCDVSPQGTCRASQTSA